MESIIVQELMLDFPIFTGLCYIGWSRIRNWLKPRVEPETSGYIISTTHALMILPIHAWMVLNPNHTQSLRAISIYNLAYACSLSYFILDLQHMIEHCRKKGYFWSMVFHHVLGIATIGLAYLITNFASETNFNWQISLAFLSELSTPLLNYIQYYHGRVPALLKCVFMWLYFWCRPVSFTYLSYIGIKNYGFWSTFSIACNTFTLLNYYWFYRIYQKSLEMIRPSDDDKKDDELSQKSQSPSGSPPGSPPGSPRILPRAPTTIPTPPSLRYLDNESEEESDNEDMVEPRSALRHSTDLQQPYDFDLDDWSD